MAKFLDQAGLVALWGKIKNYVSNYVSGYVGNATFSVKGNSNTTNQVITMNDNTNRTLQIKGDDTWISGTATGVDNAAVITLSHKAADSSSASDAITDNALQGNYPTLGHGQEVNVVTGVTLSKDSKGHVVSASVTKNKIHNPNNATFNVKTQVGATTTIVSDFTSDQQAILNGSNQEVPDDITFIQGSNIVLTPDTSNRTITIEAVATAPNNGEFSINKKVGSTVTEISDFTADQSAADSFTLVQGDQITLTGNQGGKELTVAHETITNTNSSTLSQTAATATGYTVNGNLLESLEFKHKNGHITEITPVYRKLGWASENSGGLMSPEDKRTLNQVNQTIANALTSAITPKGSVTPKELVDLVTAEHTILSANHVGDLYQLVAEEDTGSTFYGKPLATGNTQSGDVSLMYSYITEGASITNTGTLRKEFAYGTYFMVVNEGTSSNPSYKLDVVSGLYDMSNYWSPSGENGSNTLKPIPVDVNDDDYESGDETIDSICV